MDIKLARRPGGTRAPRRNKLRPKRRKNDDEVYSVPIHNHVDDFAVQPVSMLGFTVTAAPTSYIPFSWSSLPVYGILQPTLYVTPHIFTGFSFVDTENTHRLVARKNAKNQRARTSCRKPCARNTLGGKRSNMVGRKNHKVYAHSDRDHRQRNI